MCVKVWVLRGHACLCALVVAVGHVGSSHAHTHTHAHALTPPPPFFNKQESSPSENDETDEDVRELLAGIRGKEPPYAYGEHGLERGVRAKLTKYVCG